MIATAIYGPPGTGKTTELIRMADATPAGHRSLYLAFTRAAAHEINDRIGVNLAQTIHSFCYQQLGLSHMSVVTREKLKEFSKVVNVPIAGGGIDDMEAQIGDEYLAVMSYANNRLMPEMEAYDALGRPGMPGHFQYFLEAYRNWKKTYGYVDFDDMLAKWFNSDQAPPD